MALFTFLQNILRFHRCYAARQFNLLSLHAFQPVFKAPEIILKTLEFFFSGYEFRTVNFLYIIKIAAGKTEPAYMGEFFWTGFAFIKIAAFPAEKSAPDRVTLFYFKNMVNRYRVIKAVMCIMHAAEYILTLIEVYQRGFGRRVAFKKAQEVFVHNRAVITEQL